MSGNITLVIAQLIAGIYMLGLGYKVLPNPGKKDSQANEKYFNKYRNLFKTGGILAIIYVVLQAVYIGLE